MVPRTLNNIDLWPWENPPEEQTHWSDLAGVSLTLEAEFLPPLMTCGSAGVAIDELIDDQAANPGANHRCEPEHKRNGLGQSRPGGGCVKAQVTTCP